jgi:hypothetical protein
MNEPGNNPENISGPVDGGDPVESLRRQLNLLFAGVLISSFTLTAFLALQGRRASADFAQVRNVIIQEAAANQQEMASIQGIYAKLSDFARTHPDFQARILSRYNFQTNTPSGSAKK